jgi:hypothetical protein
LTIRKDDNQKTHNCPRNNYQIPINLLVFRGFILNILLMLFFVNGQKKIAGLHFPELKKKFSAEFCRNELTD